MFPRPEPLLVTDAVMVAVPPATLVARPPAAIVATEVLLEDHVAVAVTSTVVLFE